MRLTHKKGYADGPFGQLHYMTAGSGAPLIMTHQSPDSMVQFEPVLGLLAEQGIQAIAVDIPGYGMSDRPDHPPTIAEYAPNGAGHARPLRIRAGAPARSTIPAR